MNGTKHSPFARIKSVLADIRDDKARAKGYATKARKKTEEVIKLLTRATSPTTIYKKQKLDRDDVIDIVSFDVVSWLKNEMRYKLNRELALSYILGDGRPAGSEDKIDENCIRPIVNDADLFTIKIQVSTAGLTNIEDKMKATIKQILRSRKNYRGSGTPTFFTTEDILTEMLLLEDNTGRLLYADEAALARKLRFLNPVLSVQLVCQRPRYQTQRILHPATRSSAPEVGLPALGETVSAKHPHFPFSFRPGKPVYLPKSRPSDISDKDCIDQQALT